VDKKGAEVGVVQPEKVTTLNQDMTENWLEKFYQKQRSNSPRSARRI